MNEEMRNTEFEQESLGDSSMNVGSSGSDSANQYQENNNAAASAYEQPRYETPRYERPKYEEPRYEKPQYQRYDYDRSYNYGSPEPARKDKKMGTGIIVLISILAAAVFGVCAGAGLYAAKTFVGRAQIEQSVIEEITEPEKVIPRAELQIGGDTERPAVQAQAVDVADLVEAAMPSIVSVYNTYTAKTQTFWGQTYTQEAEATGSGIIIGKTDTELLVVTNYHVVKAADSISVRFIDNEKTEAFVKGTDETNDLAVIAIPLKNISDETAGKIAIAVIGDSTKLRVGEPAIAIGNALGFGQSVTVGVISALDRQITTESGTNDSEGLTFIQTDAAINPGNSGGALLNSRGEVIGINSNKIGETRVEGMCYAIPTSRAKPIIEDLMNRETKEKVNEAEQGYLGISGVSVTAQVSKAYDMPEGVYIAELKEGGAAGKSELRKGDIIVSIEGSTVSNMDELKEQLTYYPAGKEVEVGVKRYDGENYEDITVHVTLQKKAD